MIANERQYRITKSWIKKFEDSLFELEQHPEEPGREWVRRGQKESVELQIEDLKVQVAEYERIKSGKTKLKDPSYVAEMFREAPSLLIKWRIAKGLTQKALGQRLG